VALRLEDVAVDRVLDLLGRVVLEVYGLTAIGADARGDKHQPRKQLAAIGGRVGRKKLAGLIGEIEQDRVRIEHLGVAVDDRRHFRVGIDRNEFRAELLALARVDRNRLVFEPGLFEKQRHFRRVRRAREVELQHLAAPDG